MISGCGEGALNSKRGPSDRARSEPDLEPGRSPPPLDIEIYGRLRRSGVFERIRPPIPGHQPRLLSRFNELNGLYGQSSGAIEG